MHWFIEKISKLWFFGGVFIVSIGLLFLAFGLAEPDSGYSNSGTKADALTPLEQQNSWVFMGNRQAISIRPDEFSWLQREIDFTGYLILNLLGLNFDTHGVYVGRIIELSDGGRIWFRVDNIDMSAILDSGTGAMSYAVFRFFDPEYNDVPIDLDVGDPEQLASLDFGFHDKNNLRNWHAAVQSLGIPVAPLARLEELLINKQANDPKSNLLISHCETMCRPWLSQIEEFN